MTYTLFWSWWVVGTRGAEIAETIRTVFGNDCQVKNRCELEIQLARLIMHLAKTEEIKVSSGYDYFEIEGKFFSLHLSERQKLAC